MKLRHIPLVLILLVVLAPLMLIAGLRLVIASLYARAWSWIKFRRFGMDTLLVYSNSPNWQEHFEKQILPLTHNRCFVINWSERKAWSWSQRFAFQHFLGHKQFCPAAVHFSGTWRANNIRFYRAFELQKKGNSLELIARKEELFKCLSVVA